MRERGTYPSSAGSKGKALAYFKAKVNKKKLPEIGSKPHTKNPEYAKLSIEDYEKKYPSFT